MTPPMIFLQRIPAFLVGTRFAIACLLLWDAIDHQLSAWFLFAYVIAVLSDIFDGIFARQLGISTVKLRQADSLADVCLYVAIAISIWRIYPNTILAFQQPLLVALAAQLALYTLSLIKFGKPPSFHTYTAKAWGLSLCWATIGILGFQDMNSLWFAIILCWINSIEEIAMTLILPEWQHDILSLFHAWKLRSGDRP